MSSQPTPKSKSKPKSKTDKLHLPTPKRFNITIRRHPKHPPSPSPPPRTIPIPISSSNTTGSIRLPTHPSDPSTICIAPLQASTTLSITKHYLSSFLKYETERIEELKCAPVRWDYHDPTSADRAVRRRGFNNAALLVALWENSVDDRSLLGFCVEVLRCGVVVRGAVEDYDGFLRECNHCKLNRTVFDKLRELGEELLLVLLSPFKIHRHGKLIPAVLGDADERVQLSKVKALTGKLATRSGGSKCAISGRLDPELKNLYSRRTVAERGLVFDAESLRVAWIVPPFLGDVGEDAERNPVKKRLIDLLNIIFPSLLPLLSPLSLASPENSMTLTSTVHSYFTSLQIYLSFLHEDSDNIYYRVGSHLKHLPPYITTSRVSFSKRTGIPPPCKYLLSVHRCIAKVYAACGVSERLCDIDVEGDRRFMLREDGGDAALLRGLLTRRCVYGRGGRGVEEGIRRLSVI